MSPTTYLLFALNQTSTTTTMATDIIRDITKNAALTDTATTPFTSILMDQEREYYGFQTCLK